MNRAGALTGRTVVVTRATEQAGTLRSLFEAEGATVIELPLVRTADATDAGDALAAALAAADSFDWIVVTSPNGAARVRAELGDRPVRARWAGMGRATADALGRDGVFVPRRQVAEGFLAEFADGPGTVLLAQGNLARPVLSDGLRAKQWTVTTVEAYRTEPRPVAPELLATLTSADVITFASGSAVRAFLAAAGPVPAGLRVVSIGPATTAEAQRLGVSVTATAADHSLVGLVGAVVEALGPAAPGAD